MMWARIENGRIVELTDLDPEGRFPPGAYNWQVCPDDAMVYWAAIDNGDETWSFGPYVPPPPTPYEILVNNQAALNSLLANASRSMAPVLVSLNLGDATDDETVLAKQWQTYYRELKLVDLTVEFPAWPTPPPDI